VRYCTCGLCNHCHIGGVLYTGYGHVHYPHWYHNSSKLGMPAYFGNGQSHGGHGYIPDNTNHVHKHSSHKHYHGGHKKKYGGHTRVMMMVPMPQYISSYVPKPKYISSYAPQYISSYAPQYISSYKPKHRSSCGPRPTQYQKELGLSRYRAPGKQNSVASLLGFEYM